MPDDFTWLASELGFAELVETEDGIVANDAARVALEDAPLSDIVTGVCALTGRSDEKDSLQQLVQQARQDQRGTRVLSARGLGQPGHRVIALGAGEGRARVTIIPLLWEEAESLQRRAGLVDLAAAVSHEVANAMAAIGGWAELAQRGDQTAVDPLQALKLIGSCAQTAEGAARRLLSLASGETDHTDEGPTDASELTREVVDLLSLSARQARVVLKSSIQPSLIVAADRSQLFTVVWNLTKNAIEACPSAATVEVTLQGDEQNVVLTVRDTGAGLDKAAREQMFTPYYTTKAAGTGLGLALVKQTIESVDGDIQVDSIVGRGTTFRIALPRLTRPSETRVPPQSERVRTAEGADSGQTLDASILVVDDDHALREMVATALSLKGARVTTAANSSEARAVQGSFDIALIDMMLDDCRGDELLAVLRREGTVNAAMLVTGTVQKPKLVPGGEPDDWVRKPFELSHLVDRLKRTLERHRMLSLATASAARV
jgi:signal transduction histidine kinase/CheY-like chemotaxis protein